jgi:hypothetical protein
LAGVQGTEKVECILPDTGKVATGWSQGGLSDGGVLHIRGNPVVTAGNMAMLRGCTCLIVGQTVYFVYIHAKGHRAGICPSGRESGCRAAGICRAVGHHGQVRCMSSLQFHERVHSVWCLTACKGPSVPQVDNRACESGNVLHFMWCRQLQLALGDVLRVRFVKHDDSKYAQPTAMQMVQFCTRMLQFPAHWVRINLEHASSECARHTQRLLRKTAE